MSMMRIWVAAVLALSAGMVNARPARPAEGAVITDPVVAAQRLDEAAASTLGRLPTCDVAINTRVSEWKASASIACKRSSGAVDACVAAQLVARADQLRRLRSCKFL